MSDVPLSAIQATLAKKSLAHFVKKSWHILEPATPLVWSWPMQAICDSLQALLQGEIPENNLLINVPPGTGKSRIVSVSATAWWWIQHPEWRGIFASGNPRLSVRDSLYCRRVIQSPWYQRSFAPSWRLVGDQNTKTQYTNDATGFRLALTAKQAVTGERGDALFWDDPIDAADANSRVERDAVITWYDQAYANRLNDLRTGKRCGIAQRLHEGDLSGHVLKSQQYAHLNIPQEYVAPPDGKKRVWVNGFTDPRTAEGELMDPVRFPAHVLQAEKLRLGSAGYSGQHQQNPVTAEGELFKRRYWKFYKALRWTLEGVAIERTPEELCAFLGVTHVIVSADTALSEKKSADFSVFTAFGVSPTKFYVLDQWKAKQEGPDVKRALQLFAAKWHATAVVVEGGSSHGGKYIAQELKRDTALPIVEITPILDKVAAANIVLPTVEAGAVMLPEDLAWTSDFVDSTAGFPRLVHDDDVDSFRIGLSYIITGTPASALLDYLRESMGAA